MKVANFSYDDSYGAQGAAYDLHRMLLSLGMESHMYVRLKTHLDDDSVEELWEAEDITVRMNQTIDQLYFKKNRLPGTSASSFDSAGLSWNEEIEEKLKQYDIFHIHWITGFLSIDDIKELIKLGKPVIWTMHDFHPFTGGCHYPENCDKYRRDCNFCYQLCENTFNITHYQLLDKKEIYGEQVHLITASNWLREIVQGSLVFQNTECRVIPIGIDMDMFYPVDKIKAKRKFGFPENMKIMLMGAQSVSQNVKGYIHLKKIFSHIQDNEKIRKLLDKNQICLASFGRNAEFLPQINFPYKHMGFISDKNILRELYSAADVFLFPSTQETFGMTAVESMACGTPVVSYDVCAMKEVIVNEINGYKATINDHEKMAENIIKLLTADMLSTEKCRKRVLENYSLVLEAEKVIDYYHSVLYQLNTKVRKETNRKSEMREYTNNFIDSCVKDIYAEKAINQDINNNIEVITQPYNTNFISPTQKVKTLMNKKIFAANIPLYLYSSGDIGIKMLHILSRYGIKIEGFYESDKNKWGKNVEGYMIYEPVKKNPDHPSIILITTVYYGEVSQTLEDLGYLANKDFY